VVKRLGVDAWLTVHRCFDDHHGDPMAFAWIPKKPALIVAGDSAANLFACLPNRTGKMRTTIDPARIRAPPSFI
jgi:hypothetical protein